MQHLFSLLLLTAPAPKKVDVEIITDAMGPQAEQYAKAIDERVADALQEGTERDDSAAPSITIKLSYINENERTYGLTALVDVDGKQTTLTRTCELCAIPQLLDSVSALLGEASAAILADEAPPPPTKANDQHPRPEGPPVVEPDQEPKNTGPADDKRMGRLGIAGISIAATGVIGIGVGVPLIVKKPRFNGSLGVAGRQVNSRPLGYAFLGIGGAFIATGAVMLITDVRRHRRSKNISLLPTPGGAVITGRF